MKKYWPIVIASFIGLIFGNVVFKSYEEETVMTSDSNVYMLQYGAYTNMNVLNDVLEHVDKTKYIVIFEEEIYYVYFAITTNYDHASLIKKLYAKENVFLYIKNNYLGDKELIKEIKKIDEKISHIKNNDIFAYCKDSIVIYKNKQ